MSESMESRGELFRGINMLLKSGGGSPHRPFPYTDEEMMRDRGTLWGAILRTFRRMMTNPYRSQA